MKRASLLLIVMTAFIGSSCVWVPTGMRIGGTPVEKFEKKGEQREEAKEKLLKEAQRSASQTVSALETPPSDRRDEVAKSLATETKDALNQALGSPEVGDTAKWQKLVQDLLSDNQAIRASAEAARLKDRAEIARIGQELAQREEALKVAEGKAISYAKEVDRIADMLRKVVWWAAGIGGVWLVGQILALVARFNPAIGGAAALVNSVAAPGVQFVANRAQKGVEATGKFLRMVEDEAPEFLNKAEALLRQATDADHQATIIAARNRTYN